jgi:hypothetical protein
MCSNTADQHQFRISTPLGITDKCEMPSPMLLAGSMVKARVRTGGQRRVRPASWNTNQSNLPPSLSCALECATINQPLPLAGIPAVTGGLRLFDGIELQAHATPVLISQCCRQWGLMQVQYAGTRGLAAAAGGLQLRCGSLTKGMWHVAPMLHMELELFPALQLGCSRAGSSSCCAACQALMLWACMA